MKINSFLSFMFATAILILINTPSIKVIFISSELVNILGIGLLLFVAYIRVLFTKIRVSNHILLSVSIISLLWVLLLLSAIWSPSSPSFKELFQYLAIMLVSIATLLLATKNDVRYYVILQLVWSLFIAILQLTVGIQLNRDLGQHYLTIGFPLGIGFVISSGLLIDKINNIQRNISSTTLSIGLLFIFLLALIDLSGRSPVIMSVLTIFYFWFLYILSIKGKKIKNLFIFGMVLLFGFYAVTSFASESLYSRFLRLINNFDSEPRWEIYSNTLKFVKESPLYGYGLNSYNSIVGGNYPHNIFLEVTFYSGILGLVFLMLFMLIFINSTVHSIKEKNFFSMAVGMIALYSFFIWNVSYSLSSSYIVFVSLCLFIKISKNKSINGYLEQIKISS